MKTKITILLAVTMLAFIDFSFSQNRKAFLPWQNGNAYSVNRSSLEVQYVPGQIVIKVKEGLGPYQLQEGEVSFGVPSLDQQAQNYEVTKLEKRFRHKAIPKNSGLPDLSRIYRIQFPEKYPVADVAKAFSSDPNIEYAEPEAVYTVTEVPDDAMYGQCQHLPQIHAPEAWEIHKGENGDTAVVIAIVDTGTDWLHEDLTANTWQNLGEDADGDGSTLAFVLGQWQLDPGDLNSIDDDGNEFVDDLIGWDFHDFNTTGNGSNPDPQPGNPVGGHGSHCAGIAAGMTDNGIGIASVSWNLKYMPVQASNGQNSLNYGYDGIIYAAEQGADFISNSWGGGGTFSQADAEVIAYATGLGSIVLAAGGNDNLIGSFYPACLPGVISVASVNTNDTKSDFSNFGPWVDVAAPGGGNEGGILSTVPGNQYEAWYGTSMATPMVAGLGGLIKSYHPDWTNEQIITQLLYSADNINAINPQYVNMLGSGRINAYRALTDTGIEVPQELEFVVDRMLITDENNNSILEAGEDISLNFIFKNCSQLLGCENVTFTLTSEDEDIQVTSGPYEADFQPDGFVTVDGFFQFHVSENATPHIAHFTMQIDAPYPVVSSNGMEFMLSIAPGGILVIDLFEKQRDMSGRFIMDCLDDLGLQAAYTIGFPQSLKGFKTVFLSCGNLGVNQDQGYISTEDIHKIIIFLASAAGGNVYIDCGGLFLGMYYTGSQYYTTMCNFFGVQTVDWPSTVNLVDNLEGTTGTIMEGIQFNHSGQLFNFGIDDITPKTGAVIPFVEEGYGHVAVYNQGGARKTFYLGYSLAELEDRDRISSRYNALLKILGFFAYDLPGNYAIASFKADNRFGKAPLQVNFQDISLFDPGSYIANWKWDFNGDGVIDSEEANPDYTYEQPGNYDVTLIVTSSSGVTDTLVQEDFIGVRHGMFVYEVAAGARNFSGAYIRDFLQDYFFFDTEYDTVYPLSFLGYDAIFLSHGFDCYYATGFPDGLVGPMMTYLESGGRIYLEGGDVFGFDLSGATVLFPYFGLSSVSDGIMDPLTQMEGQDGALTEGMVFTGCNQTAYPLVDQYTPDENGVAAFIEDELPVVALQHGNDTYKTFCFSYALAELADNETTTRYDLLTAIMEFFGFPYTGEYELNPSSLKLKTYPNPAREQVRIEYDLQEPGMVELSVLNLYGTEVETLVNERQPVGHHQVEWNPDGNPSGFYFCRIRAGSQSVTAKVLVIK